jgi:transposase
MKILAMDLGKNKSVYVEYVCGGEHKFGAIGSNVEELSKLLRRIKPDRVVIEACPAAGWVSDLVRKRKIELEVANGNDERWRWKTVKNKSDRSDALKLAQLSEMGSLPPVHVPEPAVRQWRSLIEYRQSLVERRTAMKNSIRAIYEREGLHLPGGAKAWNQEMVKGMKKESGGRKEGQLWLLQVSCELEQLETVEKEIGRVEEELEKVAEGKEAVKRLQEAPCVGARLSEAVVAILDDPHRFQNGRQVGCYAGLTPRRWQSGKSDRQGHISRAGNGQLRQLLVQIAWMGVRRGTWMRKVFEQVSRGSPKRKKIAIVAVARRLLVRLWAMLRDGSPWQERPESTVVIA